MGWQKHSELTPYYSHADIGLLPFLDGAHVRIGSAVSMHATRRVETDCRNDERMWIRCLHHPFDGGHDQSMHVHGIRVIHPNLVHHLTEQLQIFAHCPRPR